MSDMNFVDPVELDEELKNLGNGIDDEPKDPDDKGEEEQKEPEKVGVFKRGWRGLKNLVNKGRKNPVVTGVVGLVAGAGAGVAGKMVYDHFASRDEEVDEGTEDEAPLLEEYREAEEDYGTPEDE